MRREKTKVEDPTRKGALKQFGVPSIPLKLIPGVDTGWNDTLFLIPGGRPLFIEFKDPLGKVSKKQIDKHELLVELGYDHEVHYSKETALEAIRAACALAGRRAQTPPFPPCRKRR